MHRSIIVACTLPVLNVLSVFPTMAGARADNATLRRAIMSAYHRENVSAQHRDVEGALANFSPHWYGVMPNGSILTYTKFVQNIRSTVPFTKSCTFHDKVLSFSMKGNVARVVTENRDTQVILNSQTQQTVTIMIAGKGVDYWQRQNGRWMHIWSKYLSYKASSHPDVTP